MKTLSPYKQSIKILRDIREMDGLNPKCSTCDCVILPLARYIVNMIIEQGSGDVDYEDNIMSGFTYWNLVKDELDKRTI